MDLWRFGEGKRMGRKFTQWISSFLPHSLAEFARLVSPRVVAAGVHQLCLSLSRPQHFSLQGANIHLDLIVLADV